MTASELPPIRVRLRFPHADSVDLLLVGDGPGSDQDGRPMQRSEAAGFAAEATLRPLGGPIEGWHLTVALERTGRETTNAAVDLVLHLPAVEDPGWLIPGLFYGANGPASSAVDYPRWSRTRADGAQFVATGWSFATDRAATPAVFAWGSDGGACLAALPETDLGLSGVGFHSAGDVSEIRLSFPYREDPIGYDGSGNAFPPSASFATWEPGRRRRVEARVYPLPADRSTFAPVLRDVAEWLARTGPRATAWAVPSIDEAAGLAAEGLLRWHLRTTGAGETILAEAIDFDRALDSDQSRDRLSMHVAWLSGAPAAAALLRHGRRTGDPAAVAAGIDVLDSVCSNLAPSGSFWGQWTDEHGWGKAWVPGTNALSARTNAEATLFVARALSGELAAGHRHPAWQSALDGNVALSLRQQRSDGRLPASFDGRTGAPLAWDGTGALAWVPALVEAAAMTHEAELLHAARRAGEAYATDVETGRLFGAPEDTDRAPTSEDGYVAVMAYVALADAAHDADERDRWLRLAVRAADWMLTFRYTYDVAFPEGSALAARGFRSTGSDQASPANQHLHAYSLVCLPEMARLGQLAADASYLERTRDNLANARQMICRFDGDLGGRRGMMAERFFQGAYGRSKGEVDRLSHAWCLGLLLFACEAARDIPELST